MKDDWKNKRKRRKKRERNDMRKPNVLNKKKKA